MFWGSFDVIDILNSKLLLQIVYNLINCKQLTVTGEDNGFLGIVRMDNDLDREGGLLLLTERTHNIAPVHTHVCGLEL